MLCYTKWLILVSGKTDVPACKNYHSSRGVLLLLRLAVRKGSKTQQV